MQNIVYLFFIAALGVFAYYSGVSKAKKIKLKSPSSSDEINITNSSFSSLNHHYGICTILWGLVPTAIAAYFVINNGSKFFDDGFLFASNYFWITAIFLLCISAFMLWLKPNFRAREHSEKWVKTLFIASALVSISITILIFASVLFESLRFFEKVNFFDFFFGLEWSPQTALRSDQAGSSGKFGIIPVFAGTFLITLVAMVVAVPLGLMSAIYLSEYSTSKFRNTVKPVLEVLAGIPTVVYGYFAAVTLGPLVRQFMDYFGFNIASESALAAGFVMGVMIIPYMMSLADDVMTAVPRALRDASLGLGATKSETIKKVVIPAALPGIMGAFLLAVSRAIGETMIVVMAAGLLAKLTLNPFESVTTVTAQIVKLLVGDQEFDSSKTLAAFALSLTLFLVTLLLNVVAIMIVKKYREKYE